MLEDNRGWTFSLEEALLWIYTGILARSDRLKLKCLYDGFVDAFHKTLKGSSDAHFPQVDMIL